LLPPVICGQQCLQFCVHYIKPRGRRYHPIGCCPHCPYIAYPCAPPASARCFEPQTNADARRLRLRNTESKRALANHLFSR
jgi:hypothetical protein